MKSLSLESEDFASSFDQTPVDWKKIQQKLGPDEAAVEIMRINLPKKDSVIYAAIILKQTGMPVLITLPDRNLENREFKRYFNSIKFKVEDNNSYNVYWKKIAEFLGTVKQVYLSPDGVYNKINCLTLYDPATKQFLVEKLNIKLITNLKDLLLPRQEFASANKALLIGAPDFRLDVAENIADIKQHTEEAETFFQLLQGGINELPGTSVEVAKIGEILKQKKWSADVYTREKATEELIKTVTHSDILHIATHGFFIAADENTSQVFDASLSNIKSNSMLRSGLLLAGAEKNLIDKLQRRNSTNKDDGVLTALEVMNLNLDKTSLVILSACETAGGDVRNGEGVYGLQRAFLLAGAKSLLMSLWKVDDAATQELMVYFYTYWINGDDKNLAFRKAQLEIKNKFINPYYWGAFVLVGNQ
jgi:CHAT domain-containing protein